MKRLRLLMVLLSAALWGAGAACADPLHDAARAGDLRTVHQLVEAGANVDERDESGETPLLIGALVGQPSIVRLLLARGADPTLRNDRGMLPLHAAAFSGSVETAAFLIGGDGYLPTAPELIDDDRNRFGVTPLIVAAEENHRAVVLLLLKHGAELEWRERHGYTALTRAAQKANEDVVSLLLRSGAQCQPIDPAWLATCVRRRAALNP